MGVKLQIKMLQT